MSKLINNVHIFIIIYALWLTFEAFNSNNDKLTVQQTSYEAMLTRYNIKKRKLSSVTKYKKKLKKSKNEFAKIKENLSIVQEKLPEIFDESKERNYLKSISKKAYIKNMSFSKGVTENKGYYSIINININLRDITYLQFLVFLENLWKSQKLYNFNKLDVTNNENNERGRYQLISSNITIQTYRRK